MVIGELLNQWGIAGFVEWVTNLKEQYRVRRDWMVSHPSTREDSSRLHGVARRNGQGI